MTRRYIASATQPLVNKLSRRYALNWLGAGGLATAFVVGSHTIAKADNRPKVVEAWFNAQIADDPIAYAALYTDDGIFEDVPNGSRIQGKYNIQCFVKGVQQFFGNINIEIINVLKCHNMASAEYWFSATNNGFIPVPYTIGRSFRVRTTTIFDLKSNLIQRSADYYDRTEIMVQLGLISPPPSGAVPNKWC